MCSRECTKGLLAWADAYMKGRVSVQSSQVSVNICKIWQRRGEWNPYLASSQEKERHGTPCNLKQLLSLLAHAKHIISVLGKFICFCLMIMSRRFAWHLLIIELWLIRHDCWGLCSGLQENYLGQAKPYELRASSTSHPTLAMWLLPTNYS